MEWLRIGDVARRTGLTHRTLRHYDDLGLLVPSGRTTGDYRLYGPDDLERLLAIQHLKSLGLSLDEVAAALDDPGFNADATLAGHVEAVEQRIAAESELLDRLRRLQDAARAGWDEVLDVIALSERLRHPEAWVRFRAALDSRTSTPLPELIDVLRNEPVAGVREAATWAVVQHGRAASEAVIAHLDDPDAVVRRQMAHVLGKLADPRAAGALAPLLTDPDPEVGATAAFALGQMGGADAAQSLAGALGRGTATQRATVVGALGRLGDDALDPTLAALDATDAATRSDAVEALGALTLASHGQQRAVTALAAALADPDAEVRLTAAMGLGAHATDAAQEALRGARDHDDARVRHIARRLSGDVAERDQRPVSRPATAATRGSDAPVRPASADSDASPS